MLTAIVAIIIFALLVSAHEFGHFITAKLSGMYVDEFSIGMGPLVFAKQIGETKYSLRLLPLGGFVRVLGEDVEEEERSGVEQIDVPSERRYQNRPVWQRIIFASAGSFMNMLSAIIIFALMFMIAGEAVPIANPGTTISAVVENGPAHTAGLLPGDKIVEVDGIAVDTWAELTAVIVQAPVEQPMQVIVERENTDGVMETIPLTMQPEWNETEQKVMLGIYALTAERKAVGPIRGITLGAQATWETSVMMVDVLGDLFTGKVDIMDEEEGLTGPVGIIRIIDQSTEQGWIYVFNLAALLSINLGIINMLPIPALDGSKVLLLLYEGLRGKPIAPEKEGFLNMIGFAFLMTLIIFVTFKDVMNLFG